METVYALLHTKQTSRATKKPAGSMMRENFPLELRRRRDNCYQRNICLNLANLDYGGSKIYLAGT